MILIDIKMPNRCADCPCFIITRSDGEMYGSDGCQLMHLRFNEDVYYGKHIHNPFESRYEDCPLRNASDFLKTIADRPRGEWISKEELIDVINDAQFVYDGNEGGHKEYDITELVRVIFKDIIDSLSSADMRGENK